MSWAPALILTGLALFAALALIGRHIDRRNYRKAFRINPMFKATVGSDVKDRVNWQ